MLAILSRIFIKNRDDTADAAVRRAYGMLCGVLGIVLNALLFAGKYLAGVLSGSIAVTADAFNNLTDAGSSIITLVGFRFAGSRPDDDHPFGHGRYEYISGFVVSVVIIVMGFELGKSAVGKMISPEPVEGGWLTLSILAASVLVKLYMFSYNRRTGVRIDSAALKATATDSLGDCVSTLVVFLTTVISQYTDLALDGWGGALVAVFILWSGVRAARDTLSPLLGKAPSRELVESIEQTIMSHEEIVGIHDLMVHDYGPGRLIISVHGEVSGAGDIFKIHEAIDHIENELNEKLGCEATIHIDPVDMNDKRMAEMREAVAAIVRAVSPELSIHDFRMVPGNECTKLFFDVVLPHRFQLSGEEVSCRVSAAVSACWPDHHCVIKTEQSYI